RRLPYRAGIAVLSLLAIGGAGFAILRARATTAEGTPRLSKQLTFGEGVAMLPTLSPDGKTLVYVASHAGKLHIYEQRVDGRAAIDLSSDSPGDDSEPAISPDGSTIAFRSERDGGGIYLMSVSGESPSRLTDFGHNPSWSPDGSRIVVSTAAAALEPNLHREKGHLW